MSKLLDLFIDLFKWPVAILSLVSLPALVKALDYLNVTNMRFVVFGVGMFVYLALKIVAGARTNVSMQILAHEFTHIFFALLTLHKVTHIHLNMDESGGAMQFKGRGNWLIVIGPYFFPLFLFFMMLGITYFSNRIPEGYWINGILGYFFAYHVESIMVQIHGDQPDFKIVGFPFCIFFLPGANMFMFSSIVAFNNGGWQGIEKYVTIVSRLSLSYIELILQYFTN